MRSNDGQDADAREQQLRAEIDRLQAQLRSLRQAGSLEPDCAGDADRRSGHDAAARRLDQFAESTSGWFWETGADGCFTYLSPSVERVTGVPPEWHYGKTREEIGAAASVSPESWRAHLETLARREPFTSFVFQREGPDGVKWLQTSGVPIFDDDRAFRGYRGSAIDITARIRAERRVARLQSAIENLDELFVLWDEADRLVVCNARFREMNAAVAETTEPGAGVQDHIHAALQAGLYPEAKGREADWFAERMRRHANPGAPVPVARQDGRWILVGEHRLPDGSTATISTDITEQKRAELALAEHHAVLRAALETIPDGVQVLDDDLRMVSWNDQLFDVMELEGPAILDDENPGEALLQALAKRGEFGHGDLDALLESQRALMRATVPVRDERQLVSGRWIECRRSPISGGGYLTIYRDVSESKRLQSELEHLASTDALTGVPNRRAFVERAARELERASRYGRAVSLLLLDVDRFKSVNDNHGHPAGDAVLQRVAEVCCETLRACDTFGRIGGEEFAAVLPETDAAGAARTAERLRASIAASSTQVPQGSLRVTVSIGVAPCAEGEAGLEGVLVRADEALYEAKAAGRNRVVVAPVESSSRLVTGRAAARGRA
jgi:diguanylate cyclase (GGDEF)-like protein/PAS domain S-box-containing protein